MDRAWSGSPGVRPAGSTLAVSVSLPRKPSLRPRSLFAVAFDPKGSRWHSGLRFTADVYRPGIANEEPSSVGRAIDRGGARRARNTAMSSLYGQSCSGRSGPSGRIGDLLP